MNPLIGIALALLPELSKVIFSKDPQTTKTVLDAIGKIIRDATQTDDPAQAKQTLATDPKLEAETRIKLAKIVADEDEKKSAAAATLIAAEQQKRKDELEALKVRLENDGKKRDAELANLRTKFENADYVRPTSVQTASARNPMSWGAPIVSVVVTLGFFGILISLINLIDSPKEPIEQAAQTVQLGQAGQTDQVEQIKQIKQLDTQGAIFQIVNICIGALAASFATVISFWLGSSEGSRIKDFAVIGNQEAQARQTDKAIELADAAKHRDTQAT